MPDFPYLLSLSPHKSYSHTLPGMFLLDLPLALLSLWLFHAFIKQPILAFLPDGVLRRVSSSLSSFSFSPTGRLSLVVLSILIGTATHLVWDSFTHDTSWIYQNWAFLRGSVALPITGEMGVYKLLEYLSSVFGLAIVAVWIWHWYRTTQPSPYPVVLLLKGRRRQTFVATLPVLAILVGVLRSYRVLGTSLGIRPIVHFLADVSISFIAVFLLGLLACGVVIRRERL